MRFGIAKNPIVTIYDCRATTKESDGNMISAIADEAVYGMGVEITGACEQGFVPIRTYYGYTGCVKESELMVTSEENIKIWEESNLMVISGWCVDIVSVPKVQGIPLISLYRGSLVQVETYESETKGWARIRLLDGSIGYMRNQYLWKKEFSQAGLWTKQLAKGKHVDENEFRRQVVECAKTYLGTQYRWGGRTTAGIDCSGLTSVSYMMQGILIYRDAKLAEGYPVHEILKEDMQEGDLMYFPGHIAMYIGNGKYIHSTGQVGSGGVVINSLRPEDDDYRQDLVDSWYATGSIFK